MTISSLRSCMSYFLTLPPPPLQFSEHLKKTGKVPPPSPFHCHRPSNAARHASHATGSRPRMG